MGGVSGSVLAPKELVDIAYTLFKANCMGLQTIGS